MATIDYETKQTKTGSQIKKITKDGNIETISTYELDKHGNWILVKEETKESKD